MKNIKNKKQILEYLDKLIDGNKTFKMPKFSEIAKNSKSWTGKYLKKELEKFKD